MYCCAGTHGKTTTSAIISHLFHSSGIHFKAFIGGIMKCFDSNLSIQEMIT
ncbi:MAG: hypothetical protein CM15mP102_07620 [Flavobacteriales bacterium]|nr:MAG: hypothetical protein CM15mP102_07620 [Flavobacteriales bacterium]